MEYGLYDGQELQYSFIDLINMRAFKIKDEYILEGTYIDNIYNAIEEGRLTEEEQKYIADNVAEEELDFNLFEKRLHGQLYLPPFIKEIGENAFCSLSDIDKIVLPENLEIIRSSAFASSGITEIKIPDNVTIIERCAFYNCFNLKEVILPDNLKIVELQNFAPSGCKFIYKDIEFNSISEMQQLTSKEYLDVLLDKYNLRVINGVRQINFRTDYLK